MKYFVYSLKHLKKKQKFLQENIVADGYRKDFFVEYAESGEAISCCEELNVINKKKVDIKNFFWIKACIPTPLFFLK